MVKYVTFNHCNMSSSLIALTTFKLYAIKITGVYLIFIFLLIFIEKKKIYISQ